MPDPFPTEVVWHVRPLAAPQLLRHCRACAATRVHVSCERFRVNAQQRRLDVWLLYRCATCAHTWKRSVLRRVSPDALAPGRLEQFLRDDLDTAREAAFVPTPGLEQVPADAVVVERPPLDRRPVLLRLTVRWPCGVRLDRLLAAELGCTRARLARLVRAGDLQIDPGGERALRHPPRDGTRLLLPCGWPPDD